MNPIKKQVLKKVLEPKPKTFTSALILAAGNSTRMGGTESKQFLCVKGIPVLARTLLAYQNAKAVNEIIVATRVSDIERVQKLVADYKITKLTAITAGGTDRVESAHLALDHISKKTRFVAVADGARCLIRPEEIDRVCKAAYQKNAAVAACPVYDTVKRVSALGNVKESLNRNELWTVQTPQVFQISLYAAAITRTEADGIAVTDDASMLEHLGYGVYTVPCSRNNIKITTPEDIVLAEAILTAEGRE